MRYTVNSNPNLNYTARQQDPVSKTNNEKLLFIKTISISWSLHKVTFKMTAQIVIKNEFISGMQRWFMESICDILNEQNEKKNCIAENIENHVTT